jgi:hypothetical protein
MADEAKGEQAGSGDSTSALTIDPVAGDTSPKGSADSGGSVPPGTLGLKRVPTRYYVAAIVAFTTLATSLNAKFSPNETSARKSYDVLANAIQEQGKQLQQMHDDQVALRAYVDGYVQYANSSHTVTVSSAASPTDRPYAAVPVPSGATLKITPVVKPAPPPPTNAVKPTGFQPPSYKSVTGKEDLPL